MDLSPIRRIDALIARRTTAQAPPLTISRRRLYILPTTSGLFFAVLLLVLLVGATNYGNNLIFALTFWLGAAALVSMHRTHRNLVGIEIVGVQAAPVFAGSPAEFAVTLVSHTRLARQALRLSLANAAEDSDAGIRPVQPSIRLEADSRLIRHVTVPTLRRGVLVCPPLRLESVYPIGLFRAWSRLRPDVSVLVYPRAVGDAHWPDIAGADSGSRRAVAGHDEFASHRRYRPGDSPRDIDWKASARSSSTLVREHDAAHSPLLWFDYAQIGGDAEARLSQLALWVCRADSQGRRFGLILPEQRLGPDRGPAHRDSCLKALALF